MKANLWGRPNGWDLRLCMAKICSNSSSCGASMVEMKGGRKRVEKRDRDEGSGSHDRERGERRKGFGRNYTNTPPSSIFVPNSSILDTASLISNPNSKSKIGNTTFHQLLVPKNI